MGIPQIIMVVMMAMSVGLYLGKHGQQKKEKYNVWVAILTAAIEFALLWWGGFWQ